MSPHQLLLITFAMHSTADITAWQQARISIMGNWLSKGWFPWASKHQIQDIDGWRGQGYFNMKFAPTTEELCSDDDDDNDGWSIVGNFDEEEEDESLVRGQQLRSNHRGWMYDESKSALENRRPDFYSSLFG